ncbi:ectoine/hydroxyectoine ABC transporter permease subunit EhuD [Pseudomonas sp. NPDC089401]|uniref:ectoine/hydroxyectoine ABC transporter permease subunit EhuD n=1 Tax=Pseudomonas sp. NPDC089401 TaxID=3364462 RepID=UPI0037FD3471
MNIFDWDYAWEILPELLLASVKTLQITVFAFCIAVVVGLFLALARRSHIKTLSWSASLFIEFMRSTPLLIQIYFIFYVFPTFSINLSAMQAGLIGLGLHYACYLAEVYRGGLESVPRGQWEAVTALNMKASAAYRRIIIPQALKPILPPMGNYLIAMLKETPVLSAITVVEIMLKAKNLGSESFRFLEPITMVGAFFLIISIVLAVGVRNVESRLESQK